MVNKLWIVRSFYQEPRSFVVLLAASKDEPDFIHGRHFVWNPLLRGVERSWVELFT